MKEVPMINTAPEEVTLEEPSIAELTRGLALVSAGVRKRNALAAEKKLKGFYTDWLFNKLNLTSYR